MKNSKAQGAKIQAVFLTTYLQFFSHMKQNLHFFLYISLSPLLSLFLSLKLNLNLCF